MNEAYFRIKAEAMAHKLFNNPTEEQILEIMRQLQGVASDQTVEWTETMKTGIPGTPKTQILHS